MSGHDYLSPILLRKQREVARRLRHRALPLAADATRDRGALALERLRRPPGQPPRIIAEIKRMSPSAGVIRAREHGDIERIAAAYEAGGAAAVSVLCDGPGFGGSPLDLRRAAAVVRVPLLFKEFVLHERQIVLARAVGAHMVLLLVRALSPEQLRVLTRATLAAGMAPVVEAASADEVGIALTTEATLIGVNSRDLGSFQVDTSRAQAALSDLPKDRIAIHMSGVRSREDFLRVAAGRADAVLIGEGLMRAASPERALAALLGELDG